LEPKFSTGSVRTLPADGIFEAASAQPASRDIAFVEGLLDALLSLRPRQNPSTDEMPHGHRRPLLVGGAAVLAVHDSAKSLSENFEYQLCDRLMFEGEDRVKFFGQHHPEPLTRRREAVLPGCMQHGIETRLAWWSPPRRRNDPDASGAGLELRMLLKEGIELR